MTTVRYLLRRKGTTTLSVDPGLAVCEALQRMIDHNIGSLLVVDNGKLVGLFTERDFARQVALKGRSALEGVVGDLMTQEVLYVSQDTTIEQCMALMTEKRTRHLPVLEHDEVVGIVSIGDVVKRMIEDRDGLIDQLERYITGR